MKSLPIETALPQLREAMARGRNAVLSAAPGAGKTTRVPLALMDETWLAGRKIVMLEPRRLAARAAAQFMAQELGEPVGRRIGYRIKRDTRVGPHTVVEVVTEGVLTRMLQHDPALEGVGAVIFDEFHERSLYADTGLALCLQAQELLRPDLRLLVMSATLDGEGVARLLGDAPVITAPGRMYPVETIFAAARRMDELSEAEVAQTVRAAMQAHEGDALVFLPGAAEIRRVRERLEAGGMGRGSDIRVLPLYGQLSQREQDEALELSPPGRRKVVLATSIAETSLTVEGVRIVVDSGWARVPRFSPRTGMTRLETQRVSLAGADQRRGRAGRTAPGVCYRLWTEGEQQQLQPYTAPEIMEADLAPLLLELAVWGVRDPGDLAWLDEPPAVAIGQARELLEALGAIDAAGQCTPHGRHLAELPLHPRLAHMMLQGARRGQGRLACELAALLSERDVLRFERGQDNADMALRLATVYGGRRSSGPAPADSVTEAAPAPDRRAGTTAAGIWADEAACRRIREDCAALQQDLAEAMRADGGNRVADTKAPLNRASVGLLLSYAYPERIARRRPDGRYLLAGGRGAAFARQQPLSDVPWIVAAQLDDVGTDSRIRLAAELPEAELLTAWADRIAAEQLVYWDRDTQSVRAMRRERLGAILLREVQIDRPDPDKQLAALLDGIRLEGLDMLPWTAATRQWRQRLSFMHAAAPEQWPDGSDEALLATLETWLAPHAAGCRSRADLQRLPLASILESALTWAERNRLGELAPTHLTVPSGSRIPVDYGNPSAPVLAVRLQEVFGWSETPRLAGGRVPVVMHLLSPAHRPVQVTSDLASFWRSGYFEVKKDLKGRYPKHYWPEDPLEAVATNRVRPKPQSGGKPGGNG